MPQVVDDDLIDIRDRLDKERIRLAAVAAGESERWKKEEQYARSSFHESLIQLLNLETRILSRQKAGIESMIDEIFEQAGWRGRFWEYAGRVATYINTCGR